MKPSNRVHHYVVNFTLGTARAAGFDTRELVRGLSFSDGASSSPWAPWDDYCVLLERVEDAAGGSDGAAALWTDHAAVSPLAKIAGTFLSALQLCRFVFEVVDPFMFPAVRVDLRILDEQRLFVTADIHHEYRGCRALIGSSAGAARALPVHLGLPHATVEADGDERHSEYRVTLPESNTVFARARRGASAAIDALVDLSKEMTRDAMRLGEADLDERLATVRSRYRLTPRQHEVVSHLVQGRSNKEIAAALSCSENTVEMHVTEALRKFGVESRAQLIARFWSMRAH